MSNMVTPDNGKVLIIGGNSDMARALSRVLAKKGFSLLLTSKKTDSLVSFSKDLSIRYGVDIELRSFDVTNEEQGNALLHVWGTQICAVVSFVGYMPNQGEIVENHEMSRMVNDTNYLCLSWWLEAWAEKLSENKGGVIVGLSSVAGDRGRKSNYYYGASKAALTAFMSGLRGKYSDKGVDVITVKPGFVKTKLTASLNLPKALTTSPENVANRIIVAIKKRHSVIYVGWYWRCIMIVIKALPESLFKRLSI